MRTRALARREKAELEKQPFRYDPLKQDHIRLFTFLPESTPEDIRCAIHHKLQANIQRCEGAPIYVALSYCWGDPTPVAPLILNGHAFQVARNLLDWLKACSTGSSGTYFWVDAICIDQSNIPERSEQVHQMWRIYSNAAMVISWLGLPDDNTTKVFGILHTVESMTKEARRSSDPDSFPGNYKIATIEDDDRASIKDSVGLPENSEAFREFWKLDYWRRVWIVPEVINANHIDVQSGRMLSLWQYLDFIGGEDLWPRMINALFKMHSMYQYPYVYDTEQLSQRTLFFANLITVTSRRCTDPRDKFFAMASLPAHRYAKRTATFPVRYDAR